MSSSSPSSFDSIIEILVGTYASRTEQGIELLHFHPSTGKLMKADAISGIENPSFLTVDPTRGLLFAVSETEQGEVVSYRVGSTTAGTSTASSDTGTSAFVEINRQPTNGVHPCHLSLSPTGDWLYAANYTSGGVCLYPVADDGTLGSMADQAIHDGHGVHPDRQEQPHAHFIAPLPDNICGERERVLAVDLGIDTLFTYERIPHPEARLKLVAAVKTDPGAGPRHAAIHPTLPIAYVIEELLSRVTIYRIDTGNEACPWTSIQTVSTLPDGEEADDSRTAADIHLSSDGRFLYASNRGIDSIAVFRVQDDGSLTAVDVVSSEGRTPRYFMLLEGEDAAGRTYSYLLAANQDSDSIVVFRIDPLTGLPHPTGESLNVRKPVCLQRWKSGIGE